MKRYSFKMLASEPQTYGIVGDYIHIFSAIGDLTIKTDTGDNIVLPQSMGWRVKDIFTTLTIVSSVPQTISFYAGFGQMYDGRTIVIDAVDISGGETIKGFTRVSSSIYLSVLVSADDARRGILLQNVGDYPVIVGGSDISGNDKGIIINPGNNMAITQGAKAAWYVKALAGSPVVNGMEIL